MIYLVLAGAGGPTEGSRLLRGVEDQEGRLAAYEMGGRPAHKQTRQVVPASAIKLPEWRNGSAPARHAGG